MIGPRTGQEDLVLLHGFAGTHRTWDGVLSHLEAERYRPLALDLPCHGELADVRQIDFAGAIASVLERSPRRFALCGYSMGARIALQMALVAPERLSRLVLVAGGAGIADRDERAARRAADRALADEIESAPIEDFVARWCAQPLFADDPVAVQELASADYRRNDPAALAAALRGLGTGEMESMWARLPELTTPIMVVVGDRDDKFQEIAWKMIEQLPEARLRILAGGHRLPLECPAAVALAIGSQ
ncbi:MAG TPA: alpha/beta fold hydrolase [Solirubrobacteraceae bacterium]|jgi:2-succinyl-6-hydroxy-2,4-cyclohexadiene-1-carboxylate synthase|nr:alpha/beta fold hydrolase [Solirubrobacteraceae bacterium]